MELFKYLVQNVSILEVSLEMIFIRQERFMEEVRVEFSWWDLESILEDKILFKNI